MRPKRDFRPQQLYAITQRGNQGQWVYRDAEDFTKALDLIRKYATLHQVAVHGWCLLHNHGHWIFEASTTDSISNVMRDMQSRYSHYLNTKYKATPWLLIAPLYGCRDLDHFSPYLRMGPVNWTPRYNRWCQSLVSVTSAKDQGGTSRSILKTPTSSQLETSR